MPEEENPTKREFRFKAKEFERLNAVPATKPQVAASVDATAPIETGAPRQNDAGTSSNPDVLALLRINQEHAKPFDPVPPLSPWWKRNARLWYYLAALIVLDAPMILLAHHVGHTSPFVFAPLIGAIAYFTSWITWKIWVLRV